MPVRLSRLAPLILVAALFGFGCATSEPWTFGLSRAAYANWEEKVACADPDQEVLIDAQAYFYAGLLALPYVVDLVLLPVALPRDWIVEAD